MANIDPHRIDDLAARRLARVAQVAALPPQPLRPTQNLWQLTRRAWMHSFRGPRQVGSFGPETQAAQIARLMLIRRGVARDVALQLGEQLAGIPTGEWTLELLRDILPPDQEEVLPEILSAATVPAGLTPLQWAQLTSPLGGLGEPGALIAGGTVSPSISTQFSMTDGERRTDTRNATVPAPARLGALSAFASLPITTIALYWISIPTIGYYISGREPDGIAAALPFTLPLTLDIDQPAIVEIGYDVTNTAGIPVDVRIDIYAHVSYQPVPSG